MSCKGFLKTLTRKKAINPPETHLDRFLGTFDLVSMGVGATLGLGVYILTGEISKNIAGPAVILSFAIAAFASILAGLCFAEFGARCPVAGSAYTYTFVTVGELLAFLIGWNLLIEYLIGAAAIAKGITNYIDVLLSGRISHLWLESVPLHVAHMGKFVDFFAFGIVMLISIALAFGAKESAVINNVLTSTKIVVILVVIICGCLKLKFANWSIPAHAVPKGFGKGGFFPYGLVGVVKGAAIGFFGFIGFDVIASAGEEVRNPKRSIPLSICLSQLIVFLIFVGISSVLTLMVPYYELDAKAPLPTVFKSFGWKVAVQVVSFGSVVGLISCIIGNMFPLPRILYAIADDGLLFEIFAKIHPRFKTPMWGVLISGFLTAVIAALFDVEQLIHLVSIGTLMAYTFVAMCILLLKYEYDEVDDELNDDRDGFVNKVFNLSSLSHPTKFTSRLSTFLIIFYAIFCTWLCAVVHYLGDKILAGDFLAVSLAAVPLFSMLNILIILVQQPKSAKTKSFSVPFNPWIPALSMLINIYLLAQLEAMAWVRFSVWMVIGIVIYIVYGWRHSKLRFVSNYSSIRQNSEPKDDDEDDEE